MQGITVTFCDSFLSLVATFYFCTPDVRSISSPTLQTVL